MEYSVVIPVYNRTSQLHRAVQSVFSQTEIPSQVIVVDDGSDCELPAELNSYRPSLEIVTKDHQGVSSARNVGIKESRFEWIAFLDSDDEWLPNKVQHQARWLKENPNVHIIHCDELWFRNGIRVNPRLKHRKSGGWIFSRCLELCLISPSAVIIHKKVFDDVGVFNEQLPVCEDYDLWLRISQKYPVGFVDQPLVVKHGGHADQLSQAYPAMDRFRIASLVQLLETETLTPAYRQCAIEELNRKIEIYLKGAAKRNRFDEISRYRSIAARFERETQG